MPTTLRIATFNLKELDDKPGQSPTLDQRIEVMKPQLERLGADILCLQEVNGQEQAGQKRDLLALRKLIAGTGMETFNEKYTKTGADEAWDERNLVVLSRFQITSSQPYHNKLVEAPQYKTVTEIPPATGATARNWERPIFYVQIALSNHVLHVINLHLKSRIPCNIKGQNPNKPKWETVEGWAEGFFLASIKRVGQAMETRKLVSQLQSQNANALIAVCGDFNGEMDDVPVLAIRGDIEDTCNSALTGKTLIPCDRTLAECKRFSILHHGKGYMFDHILVSRPLMAYYRGTEIHNESIHDESIHYPKKLDFLESDHAPVVAEFELP